VSALDTLVAELARLPGIGRKTAQRLVYNLLQHGPERFTALAVALVSLQRELQRMCAKLYAI
jgi:recombination protein RecR